MYIIHWFLLRITPWQERSPKKCLFFCMFLFVTKRKEVKATFPNCVKRRIVGKTQWNLIHIFAASLTELFSALSLCYSAGDCSVTLLLCASHPMSRSQASWAQQTDFLSPHSQISQLLTILRQNPLFWNPNMEHQSSSYILHH